MATGLNWLLVVSVLLTAIIRTVSIPVVVTRVRLVILLELVYVVARVAFRDACISKLIAIEVSLGLIAHLCLIHCLRVLPRIVIIIFTRQCQSIHFLHTLRLVHLLIVEVVAMTVVRSILIRLITHHLLVKTLTLDTILRLLRAHAVNIPDFGVHFILIDL